MCLSVQTGRILSMIGNVQSEKIRYIDLFAGMGGFRKGFEAAANNLGFQAECVFTSEIKPSAVKFYSENFESIDSIDITKTDERNTTI